MTDYSKVERLALSDLFDRLGPDQPTLCGGWTTHDLAVHLYVREADPIAGPGIMIPALSDTTERRMAQTKAKYSFTEIVDKVRTGPPTFSIYSFPGLGHNLNTTEYFVHHEDVRRAQPGFAVRALPAEQQQGLWRALKLGAKAMTRKAPTGLVLRLPDGTRSVAKKPTDAGSVTLTGEAAELVLFCFGRQEVAQVDFEGEPEAIQRLQEASFGV
ncbi:TIGR03085 family metal-binding protein [Kribbella sp. CA-293567]|uniref:TIGR03085 family metal-binding protein n=1 Tax=Kribbella sp. CA-293567 TaxID=3002436 RepID=UPI0022DD9B10|nr:TIGR03085 family metal-binding protein [Kribbella sp. CA-293567]WBQ02422.1 TIGR03085 family metal-binding protein [Kribbella sp. CA-293567]